MTYPEYLLLVDDANRLVVQVGQTTFRFTRSHLDGHIARTEADLAKRKARRQFLIDHSPSEAHP